jgi:hypothetical protein
MLIFKIVIDFLITIQQSNKKGFINPTKILKNIILIQNSIFLEL